MVNNKLQAGQTSADGGGAVAALDGYFDGVVHCYPLRVQYEDTDAGGIVYHAQYLAFAERGRSAWLRCLQIGQSALLADAGQGFVVRRIEIDFVRPAKLGAAVEVTSRLDRLGGASMKLFQIIRNIEDGHILARLFVDIGFVAFNAGETPRIARLPAAVRSRLSGVMTVSETAVS